MTAPTNNDYFKGREKYVYTLIKLDKHSEALEAFKLLCKYQLEQGGLRCLFTLLCRLILTYQL